MTEYDQIVGHPLAGIPQDVLDIARAVIRRAADDHAIEQSDVKPLADSVIQDLHEHGYITWPTRVPSRDALVLGLTCAQHTWETELFDRQASLCDHLVDAVILPVLQHVAGVVKPTNELLQESIAQMQRGEVIDL